jgi:drug/metabolite transporter (DMT)-like permease
LAEVPVFTLVAHRVFRACVILWVYVALRRLPLPRGARIWGAFLVMGLLNNASPFTLMAWGQQFIETGLTSIFNAATAIFGVLATLMIPPVAIMLGWMVLGERLDPYAFAAFALLATGLIILDGRIPALIRRRVRAGRHCVPRPLPPPPRPCGQ